MASPRIDWDFWSQPAFMPLMQAKVYFESGMVLYSADDIESIDFDIFAKEDSAELFGTPTPGTGTMVLIDYDQKLNPTQNHELNAGVRIELFLGFRGYFLASQLGPNLVTEIQPQVQVEYRNQLVWAVPFMITEPLDRDKYYRLSFNYTTEDGEILEEERTGLFEELFIVPPEWPDSMALALTYTYVMDINSLSIQVCEDHFEPYGVFYAQEWTYDTTVHTCTVDMADGMSELLTLDNRIDGLMPSTNVSAKTFLSTLLGLYTNVQLKISNDVTLPYTFYEDTQLKTISNLLAILYAQAFFMPDGSLVVSDFNGYYSTGISFDDDNVYSYSIQQTAAKSNDAAMVTAHVPTLASNQQVAAFNALTIATGDSVTLNTSRVYAVDYLQSIDRGAVFYQFSWDVLSVTFDDVSGFNTIFSYDPTYGWEWISEGAYKSLSNGGPSPSSAIMYIEFTVTSEISSALISWEWTNSSYTKYNYIRATLLLGDASSAYTWSSYEIGNTATAFENLAWTKETSLKKLPVGTHQLIFEYKKTSSVAYGLDAGFVRNIEIEAIPLTESKNEEVHILGSVVKANDFVVSNTEGLLPYKLEDNYYIQAAEQAQKIVSILDRSFAQDYRIIEVSFRGGYGFWVGAKIRVNSAQYGIFADYVIVNLKFSYSGIIDTTAILQRVC